MDVLSRAHALERAGRHVVHMEIGEPDFTAPAPVVEAGVRALREGRTAYTATLGLPALREAIAAHYASSSASSVPAERVAITSGASGGLLTVSGALCRRRRRGAGARSRLSRLSPFRARFRRHGARAAGRRRRQLPAHAGDGARGLGTRAPRACCSARPPIPPGTLIATAGAASDRRFHRRARRRADGRRDLPGPRLRHGAVDRARPAGRRGDDQQLLEVLLHDRLAAGLGGAAGGARCAASRSWRSTSSSRAPSAAQHAACAAFHPESLQILEERRSEFARRRDFLVPALKKAGLVDPGRAAWRVLRLRRLRRDARAFARELLEKEAVAATPGVDFGAQRHRALRALRLYAKHGRPRGGR